MLEILPADPKLPPDPHVAHVLEVARRQLKRLHTEHPVFAEQLPRPSDLLFRAWIAAHQQESKASFERVTTEPDLVKHYAHAKEALELATQPYCSPHSPVADVPDIFVTVAEHSFPLLSIHRYPRPLWAAVLRKVWPHG